MNKKKEVKKPSGQAAAPKDPGIFKDLIPPFIDEKTLGFIWRNIFLIVARVSKNPAWEISGDEESQLADGTNKVLSKHLPTWLEDYLEEFSLAITLGFIVLSRSQIPNPEKEAQAAKLEMPAETKNE